MTSSVLILIPPSEGKISGGTHPPLHKVNAAVQGMIDRLQSVSLNEWPAILEVKGKALSEAVRCNTEILKTPTMPAIERYSGVVYDGLDYKGLDATSRSFVHDNVRIVSAVFGLVAPLDLIPDYKLKINKLGADQYWRPIVSERLKAKFIIDLLPQAHRKAINYSDGIPVEFVFLKNGRKVPAGHDGKHIKGRFIRWLCQNQITDPNRFKEFKEDGFCWDGIQFSKVVATA